MVYIVSFKIVGISPLLMNNPMGMSAPSAGVGMKKIPSPEDEAASKVYMNSDRVLYAQSSWFRSSLLNACKGRRLGKIGAATVLQGAVFTTAVELPLFRPDTNEPIKTYEIDTRRAVVQGQGVRRSRPRIWPWACNLDLEVDADFIPNPDPIGQLMNIAGKISGVGDYRPQKKGDCGRFSAEMVKNSLQATA